MYNAWLLERARPYLGSRVLDLGAGTGTFTDLLSEGRELVVAAEPDPGFVATLEERFRRRPNVVVRALDAGELRPEAVPKPIESVICFNVLEHIRADAEAVRRIREVLVPGGQLLVLVPAHRALFGALDRALGHERRYDKESLRRLLEQAGFEVEVLRLVNPAGALGWLISSRLLGREQIPHGPLRLYDRLVPLLRLLDRVELPLGLSVWAVGRRPDGD